MCEPPAPIAANSIREPAVFTLRVKWRSGRSSAPGVVGRRPGNDQPVMALSKSRRVGEQEAFLLKLDFSGALVYSTYVIGKFGEEVNPAR